MKYASIKKAAGYTHVISYKEKHKSLGVLQKSFPTTSCALKFHLETMKKSPELFDVSVSQLTG